MDGWMVVIVFLVKEKNTCFSSHPCSILGCVCEILFLQTLNSSDALHNVKKSTIYLEFLFFLNKDPFCKRRIVRISYGISSRYDDDPKC